MRASYREEMERVLKLDDINLLGINNRDLGTFEAGVVFGTTHSPGGAVCLYTTRHVFAQL